MPPRSHYFWPTFWTVLGVLGLTALLSLNETAREVTRNTVAVLFSIFTTPFILETSVALVGLLIVLAINQRRINKEGDGWVYMVTHPPQSGQEELPKAITQRLQGVVLKEKPEELNENQAVAGVIEGYLELGMPSQALDELHRVQDLPDTVTSAMLRFRVLGANMATEPALSILRDAADRFPDHRPELAAAARDMVMWLQKHFKSQTKAQGAWTAEAEVIASLPKK